MSATIQVKRAATVGGALAEGEFGLKNDATTPEVYIGSAAGNKQIDYPAADKSKLSGIEAGADVTDFTNVNAALTAANADIAVNNQQITGLADPGDPQDAATKFYVDSVATGLDLKASVRVATADVLPACTPAGTGVGHTLTADAVGVLTVDGVNTVLNDRILVKNQVAGDDNGIYKVTTEGTAGVAFVLTRATDADLEITAGMFTFAEEGTANGDKGWVLTTNNPITVDTTSLTFSQFSSAGAGATTFVELTDTPANYTGAGLKVVRVNTGATALEFVAFESTYLDDTAGGTNAEVAKAPTSNVMYDHGVATTGVHGASTNTLLHSGSTIDGGTWA